MFFKKSKYPSHLENSQPPGIIRQALIFLWEIFKVVVISLAIIIPIRYFLIQPFYVKGASMEPNFYDHEYLIIDEISYRFSPPQRGEVVVFRYPYNPRQYFIKRIIGMPNERVKISGNRIYIYNQQNPEGKILEENYLPPGVTTIGEKDIQLKADEYFLLGDNRLSSLDSRTFGAVSKDFIIGRILLRGWPLQKIGFLLGETEYNL